MKYLIYLSLFGLLFGCQSEQTGETQETDTAATSEEPVENESTAEAPELIAPTLSALGGLDTWMSYNTLEYDLKGGLLGDDHQMIDMKERKVLIKADSFQIGNTGQEVWVTPSKEAVPKMPPEFYSGLYFYFFAVPYVFADPGVVLEQMPEQELGGQSYQVVRATFEDGTGDSPKDEFRLLIDPQTKQPAYLLYTVTYFDQEANENFSAIHYEEMQEVGGLQVPKIMTWYKYENNDLGEKQNSVTFENVAFKAEDMPENMFAKPEESAS